MITNSEDIDQKHWLRFKKGDKEAFSTLYTRYFPIVFEYGIKISGSRQLVKDCIQDLFIGLWRSRENLAEVNSVKAYLLRSIRRRLLSEMSKNLKLIGEDALSERYHFEVVLSPENDLIDLQLESEQSKELTEAINKLTPRQKEAIYLKFYEGVSYQDLSNILAINLKATYKLIGRAIEVLRSEVARITY